MQKIIIVGDIRGNFDAIFNRIDAINTKHGPFTAVFCIGNFFGNDPSQLKPYIQQQKTITLPTYFITSNDEDTSLIDTLPNKNNGGLICKNLTFLGRFGIKTLHGINIAYLSGMYNANLFNKTPSEIRTYLAIKELETQKNKSETENNKKLQNTKAANEFRKFYCANDIKHQKCTIDLLLTSEWPRSFHLGILHGLDTTSVIPAHLSLSEFAKLGRSPIVTQLAQSLSPKYHFCANENLFFRLMPYKSSNDNNTADLTRFISLGQSKSVYALNLSTQSPRTISDSVKYTKCPYTLPYKAIENKSDKKAQNLSLKRVVHKRKFSEMRKADNNDGNNGHSNSHRWEVTKPPPNYVCHKCGIAGHYISECGHGNGSVKNSKSPNNRGMGSRDDYFFEKFGGRRAMKRAKRNGGECWFCLGSTKLESHMIVSVAEYTYLALAKGPMFGDGSHLLLVPIAHLSNSMAFPIAVRQEIDKYLLCLGKCFSAQGKALLICDRNLKTQYSQHCYLEVFAVDKSKVKGLKQCLWSEAAKKGVEFVVSDKSEKKYNVGTFGYLILHNHACGEKYIYSAQSGAKSHAKIALNFLRRVIALHLGIAEKSEWTACIQAQSEEANQTNRLKDAFKPFDWTLSELANKD